MKPAASAPTRRQQFDGSDGALRSQSIERLSGSTAPQLERSYSDVIQLVSGSFHHVDVSPKDRTHSLGDGTSSRQWQEYTDDARSARIDDGRHIVPRTAQAARASRTASAKVWRTGSPRPEIRRGRFVNCIGQFLSNNNSVQPLKWFNTPLGSLRTHLRCLHSSYASVCCYRIRCSCLEVHVYL